MSDDLARVLAEHRRAVLAGPGYVCIGNDWRGSDLDAFHRHVADVILASGVVVSADKVRALADMLDADSAELGPHSYSAGARAAYSHAAAEVRSLLSERATDAAPTNQPKGA